MAAATWSSNGQWSVKAVCASGTADAPTLASEGIDLQGIRGFTVHVEADSTRTLSGAGTLDFYIWNNEGQRWGKLCSSTGAQVQYTVAASGVRSCGYQGFEVIDSKDRIAIVPTGVTVSAGGLTIYINALDNP